MTARLGKDCDVCNHASFHFLTKSVYLQCTQCGLRCHKQHLDDKDKDPIPSCKGTTNIFVLLDLYGFYFSVSFHPSSPAKSLLVMCNSESEQKVWLGKLTKIIAQRSLPCPIDDEFEGELPK